MPPAELGEMDGCAKNLNWQNPVLSCHLTAGRSRVAVPLSLRVSTPVPSHSPRTRTLGSAATSLQVCAKCGHHVLHDKHPHSSVLSCCYIQRNRKSTTLRYQCKSDSGIKKVSVHHYRLFFPERRKLSSSYEGGVEKKNQTVAADL